MSELNDPSVHVNDHGVEKAALKLAQLELYRRAGKYPHSKQTKIKNIKWEQSVAKLNNHPHELINSHTNTGKNETSVAVWQHDDYLLLACYDNCVPCEVILTVLATTQDQATKHLKTFAGDLSKLEPKDGEICFTFWTWTGNHARSRETLLNVPTLEEIRDNYLASVYKNIEELSALKKPDDFGKIVLWHGPPGNGKTYLIRALAQKWNELLDASIEVVSDPEHLFRNPNYLQQVLTSNYDVGPDNLRLLILEDCAELFSVEGRRKPGFNRLLNTTDGLLGQGQRVIYLLTANEEIDYIDKAVLRAGRCLQQQRIAAMSTTQAHKWLEKHGVDTSKRMLPQDASLADLFELKRDYKTKRQQSSKASSIGFGH